MRFPLRPLLNCTIAGGLVIALWPVGQTAFGVWNQRTLSAQFQAAEKAKKLENRPARPKMAGTAGQSTAVQNSSPTLAQPASSRSHAKRAAWPLTKLSIPDIGLETFVVQGMDAPALRRGPGHDANSSPPGEGNCVIAGHRNIYGSFFYRLDELTPGASITLENRDGKWTYIVGAAFITPDTNLTVTKPPPPGAAPLLTLITCTLPHTSNRIILQASLSAE